MSKSRPNCYLGLFWELETKTFKRWSEVCPKESQEISQERIKNT